MTRIAISYRRDDSAAITGRIFDRLVARYGADSVFRDVDNIPLAVDFRDHINGVLTQTDITLVVVGNRWLGPLVGRRRRIDDPEDPVRVEVETALRNGIPVVPVLVEGGAMPNVDELPDSLKELVYRNGLEVGSGRDFDQHIERLIRKMEPILTQRVKQPGAAARRGYARSRQADAARQTEEEKQGARYVPKPSLAARSSYESSRPQIVLSIIGVALALLPLVFVPISQSGDDQLISALVILAVASLAAATVLVIIARWNWPAYAVAGLNPLLCILIAFRAVGGVVTEPAIIGMLLLFALAFALESAAAAMSLSRRASRY